MKKYFAYIISSFCFAHSFAQKVPIPASTFLVNSTMKIECEKITDGKKKYVSATSFFFKYEINGRNVSVLVTNKHVIKNAIRGTLYFKEKDSLNRPAYGKAISIVLDKFENRWIFHPDSSVDLAILPIAPYYQDALKASGGKAIYISFSEKNILPDSLLKTFSEIEDVFMIGYPYGIIDDINNIPIVRKGITATPLYQNYRAKKEFLIDMPVYTGSSGSPIVFYNNNRGVITRDIEFGPKVQLLGINFATYFKEFDGKLVPKTMDTLNDSAYIKTSLPLSNIGIIIKAERLLDFKKILTDIIFKK